jgi:hypothetical protein
MFANIDLFIPEKVKDIRHFLILAIALSAEESILIESKKTKTDMFYSFEPTYSTSNWKLEID